MKTKVCSKCGKKKLLDKFSKCAVFKDGRQYRCKQCQSKYHYQHREQRNAASRNRYKRLIPCLQRIYSHMNDDCNNHKGKQYAFFGARGIKNQFKSVDEFTNYAINDLGVTDLKELVLTRIDKFDHFRKGNVHFITKQRACRDKRKARNMLDIPCSSEFKGVHWMKKIKKYMARIQIYETRLYLGLFSNDQTAAEAYDLEAEKHPELHIITNADLKLL